MRKRFLWFLLALLLLGGCQRPPEPGGKPTEAFRLGENIVIEGVDVSRLRLEDARSLVRARVQEETESMAFMLRGADAEPVTLRAADLPLTDTVEDVLREASYLPQKNESGAPRAFDVALALDTAKALPLAQSVCASFHKEPVDATAVFDKEQAAFAFTADQPGREADPEALLSLLADAVAGKRGGELDVPVSAVAPAYTEQQAREEHGLIAEFSTSFAKSPLNASGRVYNIKKAASIINGTTLAPGEEFDINEILGPRSGESGWKKAPGIREGRYEQEYGGGVCQVSTTLFNAVLLADLEVTDRSPHSWPSSYVPIGRDATISTGGPDFCFLNTSGQELYVMARTEGKKLIFSLYGRPLPDGMTVKITSKQVATLSSPGEEVLLNESLPANTRDVYRETRRGKKSKTYKEYYDRDGTLVERKLIYEDTYRSIKGLIYVSADIYYGFDEEVQEVGQ